MYLKNKKITYLKSLKLIAPFFFSLISSACLAGSIYVHNVSDKHHIIIYNDDNNVHHDNYNVQELGKLKDYGYTPSQIDMMQTYSSYETVSAVQQYHAILTAKGYNTVDIIRVALNQTKDEVLQLTEPLFTLLNFKSKDPLSILVKFHDSLIGLGYSKEQIVDIASCDSGICLLRVMVRHNVLMQKGYNHQGVVDIVCNNRSAFRSAALSDSEAASKIQKLWRKPPSYKKSYGKFLVKLKQYSGNNNQAMATIDSCSLLESMERESLIQIQKMQSFFDAVGINPSDYNNLKAKFEESPFILKHYSQCCILNSYINPEKILTTQELIDTVPSYVSSIANYHDYIQLQHTGFTFFHMQPASYDVTLDSRFGPYEIMVKAEDIGIFLDGYVSLTEQLYDMLPEISTSRSEKDAYWGEIIHFLHQKSKLNQEQIFRHVLEPMLIDICTGRSRIEYPANNQKRIRNIRLDGFVGKYIRKGLYYAALQELWYIGGKELIAFVNDTINNEVHNFGSFLRTIFRLEAHVPHSVTFCSKNAKLNHIIHPKVSRVMAFAHDKYKNIVVPSACQCLY